MEINEEEVEKVTPAPEDNLGNNLNFAKALRKNTGIEEKAPEKVQSKQKSSDEICKFYIKRIHGFSGQKSYEGKDKCG